MSSTYLEEYEISPYTMAILPEVTEEGLYSRVMELEYEYIVRAKPIQIIEKSCRFFGSSLQGRKEGTREIMGVTHKAPIVIDPTNSIYFFPTTSPTRQQCSWISHSFVKQLVNSDYDKTTIIFSNSKEVTFSISRGSLENQLYRTAQLRTTLSSRISSENRKTSFLMTPHYNAKEMS
ncbi:competence protein [Bacillus sp. BGMRC 2118]|nr:competence protein [Bacillus sp. BGMRC 2118]